MKRKNGYYWVYLDSQSNFFRKAWEIAKWDGNSFWYDGQPYNENCFSQVNEQLIKRIDSLQSKSNTPSNKKVLKSNTDLKERFKKPTDKQLVEIAVLFNDGKLDEAKLADMIGMNEFIINRLYENGDCSIPSSKE